MYTANRIRERLRRLVKSGLFPEELKELERKASDRELLLILETTFFLLSIEEIKQLLETVGTPKFEDALQNISDRRAILDTAGESLQYSMLVFLDKLARYTRNLPSLQVTKRSVGKLSFLCSAFLGASLDTFASYLETLKHKGEPLDQEIMKARQLLRTVERYVEDFKSRLDSLEEDKVVGNIESIDFFD